MSQQVAGRGSMWGGGGGRVGACPRAEDRWPGEGGEGGGIPLHYGPQQVQLSHTYHATEAMWVDSGLEGM